MMGNVADPMIPNLVGSYQSAHIKPTSLEKIVLSLMAQHQDDGDLQSEQPPPCNNPAKIRTHA